MYIKKNVFDNLLNIMMDIKCKSKDNNKAGIDLKKYYNQPQLELMEVRQWHNL